MGHTESEWEAAARAIVSAELGVPVDHQDVGGKGALDATPDALIDPEGARIQLEVFRDLDPHYAALQGNIDKHGSQLPALDGKGWLITVAHSAQVRRLHAQLPQLLAANSADAEDPYTSVPEPLGRLGVIAAWRMPGNRIAISTLGAASWDRGVPTLNAWVEKALQRNQDVPAKLGARGGGHAFLWGTATSPNYLHFLIAGDDRAPLPGSGPALPPEIRRIWVAGFFRAAAIWSDGAVWRRTRNPAARR